MTKQSNKMMEKIKCIKCGSTNIIKWCKRKTQNRGLIQRYKCKSCNKYFTLDEGFFRMRNSPQKISQSIDLFYRGVSTRKVQEHLAIFHPHNASNVSVYNWVIKYSKMISGFTDNLKVKTGSEIQIDEMEYHRRFSHKSKKKISKDWFIDSIDVQTRFMVASDYVKSRGKKGLREVMRSIKTKTEGYVTTITTDGFMVYSSIVKSTWGWNKNKREYNVKHNKVTASKGEGFNLFIERLHNSIRQRTQSFRGFHGCVESAQAIMKGYGIFYNFIRKHQAINCCPYELACPELELKSNNKWLELIRLSKF